MQQPSDGTSSQSLPDELGQTAAIVSSGISPDPSDHGWPPNEARAVPSVLPQENRTFEGESLRADLREPASVQERAVSNMTPLRYSNRQSEVDGLEYPTGAIGPGELPQYGLPGLLFGAEFQWNFDPISNDAANIWSQMPAQSWLDTSDGWDTMLRPDSPNPTEGNLTVDSHPIHYMSRTMSDLSSNVDEYVEEDGRKYHRYHEGKYLLPNDEREQDRLDLQHAAYTMLFHGQLNLAPIEQPKRVLDIATGTGIWAIQFAEKWPTATVIGTDLSPIQPDSKPRNCRFWVEDAEDPWHFDVPFDYIHARLVCTCFDDPRRVIQQAFENLEPGGWCEFQDADSCALCDDDSLEGTALDRLLKLFNDGAMHLGRNAMVSQYYKQWFIEAGFEQVVERKFRMPGNTWPKDPYAKQIGLYEGTNMRDAVDGLSKAALKRGLGMSEEERVTLAEQAKFDTMNPDIHYYGRVYVVYGRKPLDILAPTPAPVTLAGVGAFC